MCQVPPKGRALSKHQQGYSELAANGNIALRAELGLSHGEDDLLRAILAKNHREAQRTLISAP